MDDRAVTLHLTADELARLPVRLQWEVFGAALTAGDLDAAEATLAHLRATGPVTPLGLRAVERLARVRGRPDESFQSVRERAERFPDGINQADLVLTMLARCMVGTAERTIAVVLAARPADPDLLAAAAMVALARNKPDAARSAIERARIGSPDNAAAKRVLARVEWAEGRRDQAVTRLTRLVAEATSAPPATLTDLADLADALDQPAMAAELRERARAGWRQRHTATWRAVMNLLAPSATPPPDPAPVAGLAGHAPPPVAAFNPPTATAAPAADGTTLPAEVLALVRDQFGHARLRPGQADVIARTLAGVDTLATMPTGAGKSLCYQVAALALPGTTVVISPLIALMKDQVDSLPPAVAAVSTLINSTLELDELRARLDGVRAGRYKLVYVAPERLRSGSFLSALRAAGVSLLVVDEAHCISLWGHDFRPDYLFIPRAAAAVGTPRLLAMTATATPALAADIERQMRRPLARVQTSVFRPNLRYLVSRLPDREAKLRAVVDLCRRTTGSGIVYASSRELCEQMAAVLRRERVQANYYHAGLDRDERAAIQDDFMAGRLRVIVATVAFGMGVDKRNVRFIVHLSPPKSLEAYAQESGRAGRDGGTALCALLYTSADLANLKRWSRDDQLDVATLATVHQRLVTRARQDESRWVIANPTAVLAPTVDLENIDLGVVIGLLERAGLLARHPDAPRDVTLRFRPAAAASDDPLLTRLRDLAGDHEGGALLRTARLAEALALAPTDLERRLDEWAEAGLLVVRGRDRETCLELLPQPRDTEQRLQRLLGDLRAENQRRLKSLAGYLDARTCRHTVLAAHFDEHLTPCGDACDLCTTRASHGATAAAPAVAARPATRTATAADAAMVLAAVRTLPFPVGKTGLTRLLHGSIQSTIKADRSSSFGALAHLPTARIDALLDRLIAAGYLHRDDTHDYRLLSLTDDGRAATPDDLAPHADPMVTPRPGRADRATRAAPRTVDADAMEEWEPEEHLLFERLRRWRTERATAEGVPAYVILHNAALINLVATSPRSLDDLATVSGLGPAKIERYGSDLLRLLAAPVRLDGA
ncbi:MAG: RecQ family ATP-dependent DNA helicase [Chloroflexi bacterium]|nr:RecQ family ATP-dependent DNA helicase [Chloroflexota bacterium]